jgi:hypothetical protein
MRTTIRLLASFLVLISTVCTAQNPEMADTMRSEGKIYVVVTIVLVVLIGLIGYLFLVDRKVSRLEKPRENSSGRD